MEELNPFSFREFLRWKNQDPDPEQARTEVRAAQLHSWRCTSVLRQRAQTQSGSVLTAVTRVYMCIFKRVTQTSNRCGGRGCDRCGPSV